MTVRKGLVLVIGLVAFLVMCMLAVGLDYRGTGISGFSGATGIQNGIADDAEAVLVDFGVEGYELTVDGRDLDLVTASELPDSARARLAAIDGVPAIAQAPSGDIRIRSNGAVVHLPPGEREGDIIIEGNNVTVVGAGDAFASGLLYSFLLKESLAAMAAFANAAAAIKIGTPGASEGMPGADEVRAFLRENA